MNNQVVQTHIAPVFKFLSQRMNHFNQNEPNAFIDIILTQNTFLVD